MAWYTDHKIHCRGRLVVVTSRYGCFQGARVLRGKKLNLKEGSRDMKRLAKLFHRSAQVRQEIKSFIEAMSEDYRQHGL